MFERFTDRARKVMATANEQVQQFNHQYIGTEHIFLGLVKEGGGTGAAVLKNLGVDIDKMLPEVEKLFKLKGGRDAVAKGKIPQTQNAIKVIEYAIEEARNLDHGYIGTEHILLGLLRVSEGIASQVLVNLGVSIENARMEIEKLPDRQE
jgi:ATP-dependent Clp protease ATP-binding subunit ClpC